MVGQDPEGEQTHLAKILPVHLPGKRLFPLARLRGANQIFWLTSPLRLHWVFDIPDIEVISVGEPDLYSSPLGGKSVGEIGVVGVAPAIANAVFHATGKRIRDLPIRMEHRM
jgi:hypothetical protein